MAFEVNIITMRLQMCKNHICKIGRSQTKNKNKKKLTATIKIKSPDQSTRTNQNSLTNNNEKNYFDNNYFRSILKCI